MEVPLNSLLEHYSRLLQQIVDYRGRVDFAAGLEVDLDELAKATGVVVLEGLRIAKCLQQRI